MSLDADPSMAARERDLADQSGVGLHPNSASSFLIGEVRGGKEVLIVLQVARDKRTALRGRKLTVDAIIQQVKGANAIMR